MSSLESINWQRAIFSWTTDRSDTILESALIELVFVGAEFGMGAAANWCCGGGAPGYCIVVVVNS